MTQTFSLGPQPKWYLVDNVGKPTAGFLFTYDNLNPTEFKPTYQDIGGTLPNTNPIRFAENGTAGPIYFLFDTATPDDNAYYLRFYDENMNFLYDIPNYIATGGGGGSNITTAVNLKNYAGNNVYEYNIGSTETPIPNGRFLCPSNHANFIDPDIRFFNNNIGGTDTITFPEFTFGSNPLTGDVTPQYYLHYDCAIAGAETSKYIQFPIQPKVTTLDAQTITVTLWARTTGGIGNTITVRTKQFFGTPTPLVSPTDDHYDVIGAPITLNGTWTRYSVTGTISGVAGATLSPTSDDAVYLTIELPHAVTSTIDITKVSMYLGTAAPISDFNSFQQIEALIESPRTGDTKSGINYGTFVPYGWIPMGNNNIGNTGSGAGFQNIKTWFLYNMVWNNTTNAQCPLYAPGPGAPIARGVSAAADWEALNVLSMPLNVGAVISNIGNGHVVGEFDGTDTVTLTANQNGVHNHTATTTLGGQNGLLAWDNNSIAANSLNYTPANGRLHIGGTVSPATTTVNNSVGGAPHNNIQPTTYIPYIIKL